MYSTYIFQSTIRTMWCKQLLHTLKLLPKSHITSKWHSWFISVYVFRSPIWTFGYMGTYLPQPTVCIVNTGTYNSYPTVTLNTSSSSCILLFHILVMDIKSLRSLKYFSLHEDDEVKGFNRFLD